MASDVFPENGVQFGIFDWVEASGTPVAEVFEHKLRLAEMADRNGLFAMQFAEHQGTPLSLNNSPSLLIAAAIQRTKRLRLGALTWVLTWYNPFRFYSEICALDQMSHGRIELGVGRGTSPYEARYFDITDIERSREMYRETFDIFRAMSQSEDIFSYEGKYHSYENLELWSFPYQKPYPPLWFPSSDHNSIEFTAMHGYHTAINYQPPEALKELYSHYRETWLAHQSDADRHNGHVEAPLLGTSKHIYVGNTDAEAEAICKQSYEAWASHIGHLGRRLAGTGEPTQIRTFADGSRRPAVDRSYEGQTASGFVMAGTPEKVADMLIRDIETSGVNYVLLIPSFGNMAPELAECSFSMICEKVIPAVEKATSGTTQVS